jgi:hypothetical protein
LFIKSTLENELINTRSDLESRIKKYEMQLSALTENLSTVRSELKTAHEKLIDFEEIKSEKTGLIYWIIFLNFSFSVSIRSRSTFNS